MKINLGSGIKRIDGFVNVDSDPICKPDYLVNLGKDPLPFENDSIDEVVASHILEHIGGGFFFFLRDLYRVCKHSSIIKVEVPHPRHDYFLGDLTHVRPITIENMRQLSKSYCKAQSFINSSWAGYANVLDVNFEIIYYEYVFDETFKEIYKNASIEEVNWWARALNNTITEIKFDMMVIKDE